MKKIIIDNIKKIMEDANKGNIGSIHTRGWNMLKGVEGAGAQRFRATKQLDC